ncbi:MAG: tripartite tricarboxylate transporter substrate binding protein [Betaproteobacteria bacterium]|nr:MAG: tripartite tricarboxylate transporter substrate binding protein [Betaproteobacteria bacterium]
MKAVALLGYLLWLLFVPLGAANAQAYPTKPVTVVVPFPPGGSSDVIARLINAKLTEAFKQNFLADNRPGAGTLIGTTYVAKAAPDGYTLLLADVPFTVNPTVMASATYDPVKDFTPITIVGASAQFLYANPSRMKSLAELLTAAKAKPGQVTVATAGNGTTTHLMTEMLQAGAGVRLLQVPYKGSAPALNDAAAGHVDAVFSTLASAAPLVSAGKLRVIAVTSQSRLPQFADVPTFSEVGIKDLVVEHWWGLLGPAGMPRDIVQRLQNEIAKAVAAPDVRERFNALSVEPRTGTPEYFSGIIDSYVKRWARVVKENNIKVE